MNQEPLLATKSSIYKCGVARLRIREAGGGVRKPQAGLLPLGANHDAQIRGLCQPASQGEERHVSKITAWPRKHAHTGSDGDAGPGHHQHPMAFVPDWEAMQNSDGCSEAHRNGGGGPPRSALVARVRVFAPCQKGKRKWQGRVQRRGRQPSRWIRMSCRS